MRKYGEGRPDWTPIPERKGDLLTPGVKDYSVSAEIDADITTHSTLDTGVHGAGASTLATDADITTHAAIANAHHAPVTVSDTATLQLVLDGQALSGNVLGGTGGGERLGNVIMFVPSGNGLYYDDTNHDVRIRTSVASDTVNILIPQGWRWDSNSLKVEV